MAVGIGRAATEYATDYSKERVQFVVPIAMHQAIQFMIADMATKVHLSRLATWNSAVLLDQDKRNSGRIAPVNERNPVPAGGRRSGWPAGRVKVLARSPATNIHSSRPADRQDGRS